MKTNKKLIASALVFGFIASTFSTQASAASISNGDDLIKQLSKGYTNLETTVKVQDYTKFGVDFKGFQDATIAAEYQSPLSLGIEGHKYSTDKVKYAATNPGYATSDKTELKIKQAQVKKEVARITKSLIKKNMTEKQKHQAIYSYLVKKVKYDNAAVQEFNAGKYDGITDSYTAYGALVDYLAVCEGIAAAYKALADQAGLESIVVTGTKGSVGHAWNKVKINGKWSNVDATIANKLVFATDEKATSLKYKEDLQYALDSDIKAGVYSTSGKAVTSTAKSPNKSTAVSKTEVTKENSNENSNIVKVKADPALMANTSGSTTDYSTTGVGWPLFTIDCIDKHASARLVKKTEQTQYKYKLMNSNITALEYVTEFENIIKDVRGKDFFASNKLEYSVSGDTVFIEIIKK